ncbi:hypothetical protein [Metabacillus indicus]|uniref:Spore coat-associated protein N n=1 Tax=Metabacillus indicus TaxID=246786 RepID=A0A084GWG7_METID|nr:hypothetical protein [Metabacillus indicus]KEZ51679.1 hypothetical protein GS18_0211175 [Metabacillus indicus]
MKNISVLKKAMFGTALAGALVVGAGYGTYSWFSAESSATGKIVNGTLELNGGTDVQLKQKVVKDNKLAPSQLVFGDWITLDNTGNLETVLKATYSQQIKENLDPSAYKVGYIALKYKVKPNKEKIVAQEERLESILDGTTNIKQGKSSSSASESFEMTEGLIPTGELQKAAKSSSELINIGEGDFWNLKENEYIDVIFGVKLDENAGNEYQGATYTSEFKVEAKQTDDGAKFGSETSK